MTEDKRQENRKRAIKIGIAVCIVVVVLSILTASLNPEKLVKQWFGQDEPQTSELYFYPVDENEDIFEREDYMGLDRHLYYTDPLTGETFVPERDELATVDPALPFLYDYLDCIIHGDAATYPLYFSTAYLEQNELPEDFTMQMLYDICIEPYSTEDERQVYLLDYKIYRNNGTFRRDVGSNASRTLVVVLTYERGDLCIDAVFPHTRY
ncbi:MAG: hypothetical protein IIX15_01635 [Clostridia bacterium]|nr:hypothetical protein [Clostridia bacterium]